MKFPFGGLLLAALLVLTLFVGNIDMAGYRDMDAVAMASAWALLFAVFGLKSRLASRLARQPLLLLAGLGFIVVLVLPIIQAFALPTADRQYLLEAGIRLFGLAAVFGLGVSVGADSKVAERFAGFFLWASIAYCVLSLALFATHADVWVISTMMSGDRRLTGTMFTPNTAALHFGLCAFFSLAGAGAKLSRAWRGGGTTLDRVEAFLKRGWVETLSLGLALICLALTGSRMGATSMGAAVVVFALINLAAARRSGGKASGRLLVPGLLLGVIVLAGGITITRFAEASQDLRMREMIYQSHWPFAMHSGPIGYGFGSFRAVNRLAINPINFPVLNDIGGLHDVYLQWLEQAGWVGFAAMIATTLLLAAALARLLARKGSLRWWAQAGLAMCVFVALHDITDFGLEFYAMTSEWALILGFIIGMGLRAKYSVSGNESESADEEETDNIHTTTAASRVAP